MRATRCLVAFCMGCFVAVVLTRPVPPAHAATNVVPTQWIAKQYSELLGRAPTTAEWSAGLDQFQGTAACDGAGLGGFAAPIARSDEFLAAYPEDDSAGRAARITALVRAAFNREVTLVDWEALFVPYDAGTFTWDDLVTVVYGSTELEDDSGRICDAIDPDYGFDSESALDLFELLGLGTSRTQEQLQGDIDAVEAGGGGTVSLRPGELVAIGDSGNGNRNLVVRSGVTLTTTGAPTPTRYAAMGRLVTHPGALTCTVTSCDTVGVVQLERGAELRNVWVDPKTAADANYNVASVDTLGSTSGTPTAVVDDRIATPDRDGAAIRAHGYSSTGGACAGQVISRNLITGYRSVPFLDSQGRRQAANGIDVHCEGTTVTANDIIDISGDGVMLHGAYNRGANRVMAQHSTVQGNHVLSAGIDAALAYGADPVGECYGVYNGPLVPCLNFPATRTFAGSLVTGNSLTTSPRTHFDVGLLVGGFARWDLFSAPGSGAEFTGNFIGGTARVKTGIAVAGMANASVAGNEMGFTLVETNPLITFAECPRVSGVVSRDDDTTLVPGGQGLVADDAVLGCLVPPPPKELEPIAVQGDHFVGLRSDRPFVPWGFTIHAGIDEALAGDPQGFVEELRAVKRLGGNIARVPIDVIDLLDPPGPDTPDGTPNEEALHELGEMVELADQNGVYLELSGLRISRNFDNGDWFDVRDEAERWATQALFWRVVSSEVGDDDAVAWFNVVSEPTVRSQLSSTWCVGVFGGQCFSQTLNKDLAGRTRIEVYEQWTTVINDAIQAGDPDDPHLTSIGSLPYGNSAFKPIEILGRQSFGSVHVYPHQDDLSTAIDEMQRDFDTVTNNTAPGQPLVIDETATLSATGVELKRFMTHVQPQIGGWLAQYAGPVTFTDDLTIHEHLWLDMYQVFVSLTSRFAYGAQSTPPITASPSSLMVLPQQDTPLRGTTTLLARSFDGDGRVIRTEFSLTGGEVTDVPVGGAATKTPFGWTTSWDTTTVPDGTYSMASTVTDSFGLSARSEPVTFVVDNTLPDAVPVTRPTAGQRVGGSHVDLRATGDVLDVATLEFRLSGPGVNDAVIATGTTDEQGWTAVWDASGFANGTYDLSTMAFDAAGNARRGPTVSIRVSDAPIETAVTAPTPFAFVRGPLALAATADGEVDRLEFRATGGTLNDKVVSPAWSTGPTWAGLWATGTVASGAYNVVSVAYGTDGTAYRSPPVPITVDNIAPSTAVVAPKANAKAGTSVALSATASDTISGVTQVQFRVTGGGLSDAIVATGELTGSTWNATWSTVGRPSGSYSLTSVAFDRAGNTKRSTAVPITVDSLGPVTAMSSPASGSMLKGTVTLVASATDNVGVTKQDFRITGGLTNGKIVATGVPGTGGVFSASWDTRTVTSRVYSLVSVASDAVGNKTTSAPFTITVDNIAPTTTVVVPAAGAVVKGTAVALRATAADNAGLARVEFRVTGGGSVNKLIATGVSGSTGWTAKWNSTTVTVGSYALWSVAYDRAGNLAASQAVAITVQRATASSQGSGSRFYM